MKTVVYSKAALKSLSRMPTNTARLIQSKIDQYATDPASLGNNVKPLKGEEDVYRFRVGDWRVLFSADGTIIAIIRIAHRSEAYD